MKVAIIGAGIAGLCCALELEKHGIKPVIYERNGYIGEQYNHVGALLNLLVRPIEDPLVYLRRELGIDLQPLTKIKTMIHYSQGMSFRTDSSHGYFMERSCDEKDVKKQIYAHLKNTKVIFNQQGDYQKLSSEYDYVVIATGCASLANELGVWQEWFQGFLRGSVVLGDFDPNTLIAWVNEQYCKKGYAYLVPFNKKRAFVALIVPDVKEKEVEFYWRMFKDYENINYETVEEIKFEHKAGFVYPLQVKNILFSGNAAGSIEPFLGFGMFQSIMMGIYAGRSIATGESYESLVRDVRERVIYMYYVRKIFDKLGNKGQDAAFALLGTPGIKNLIYDTRLDVVGAMGKAIEKFSNL